MGLELQELPERSSAYQDQIDGAISPQKRFAPTQCNSSINASLHHSQTNNQVTAILTY